MNSLVSKIRDAGYVDRVLNEKQLVRIVGGSSDSRYGLVKRAMQSKDLLQIKRGTYVLASQYRTRPAHPFRVAQAIETGSYISMETALAFHGWIPEAVFATISVTPTRKSKMIDHEVFGRFAFYPLALNRIAFLEGVARLEIDGQIMLVAKPLRALLDLVAHRKFTWSGIAWLFGSLRIGPEDLMQLRKSDFQALKTVYKHKAVREFLSELEAEWDLLKRTQKELVHE